MLHICILSPLNSPEVVLLSSIPSYTSVFSPILIHQRCCCFPLPLMQSVSFISFLCFFWFSPWFYACSFSISHSLTHSFSLPALLSSPATLTLSSLPLALDSIHLQSLCCTSSFHSHFLSPSLSQWLGPACSASLTPLLFSARLNSAASLSLVTLLHPS